MMLDTYMRNQHRVLGAIMCLFGSIILTESLAGVLKSPLLKAVSRGLLMLMGCIFYCAFSFGVIFSVWQLVRGQMHWRKIFGRAEDISPIDVSPSITPNMRREADIFTVALLALACVAVIVSVWMRWS
jgi:hypothetical protein